MKLINDFLENFENGLNLESGLIPLFFWNEVSACFLRKSQRKAVFEKTGVKS
jgi:hypothetical protein